MQRTASQQQSFTDALLAVRADAGRVSLGPHTFVVHCRAFAGEFIGPGYRVLEQKPVELPAAVRLVPDGAAVPPERE